MKGQEYVDPFLGEANRNIQELVEEFAYNEIGGVGDGDDGDERVEVG